MQDNKKYRIAITALLLLVIFGSCIVIDVFLIQRDKDTLQHEAELETLAENVIQPDESLDNVPIADFTDSVNIDSNELLDEVTDSIEGDIASVETGEIEEAAEPNPYKDIFPQNSDMVAWLLIADTKINEPVMQTAEDENYYLNRGFDKKTNQNGCLIMDADSNISKPSTNLIIHGHNMKSGAMFGELENYKSKDYYEVHRIISLYFPDERRDYEVIAVFKSQVYKKSQDVFKFYKFFEADTEEEFNNFYDNIMKLSLYDTEAEASYGDCFLTLSTCAYHVENGRFVVVAKQIGCTKLAEFRE